MVDIGVLLGAAKLPERTVSLCLRGDLQAEFEDLERQLDAAAGDVETARTLAERIEALRREMTDATVLFRARALPRRAVVELLLSAEHQPRDGNQRDQNLGYNADTYEPAVLRACVVDPVLTGEQWTVLLDALTAGQYADLWQTVHVLNWGEVKVLFSPAAFARLPGSGES